MWMNSSRKEVYKIKMSAFNKDIKMRYVFCLIVALTSSSVFSQKIVHEPDTVILQTEDSLLLCEQTVCDSLVNYTKMFIGKPYRYGRNSPKTGFDCSGLVWYVFKHFGVDVPRSSMHYMNVGTTVALSEAKIGDIILFTRPKHVNKNRVGHLGIVCKTGDSLQFIHATSGKAKSVTVSALTPHYKKRFIKVVRVPIDSSQ